MRTRKILAVLVLAVPGMAAVCSGQGKMYWTDDGADRIRRANVDGSGIEDLVTTGLSSPAHIALDIAAGKMYWADYGSGPGTGKIQRANLDGSGVDGLVISGLTAPSGIALDTGGGKMYWTDVGMIRRANLDGSDVEILVSSGLSLVSSIALDVAGGKMYWTDWGNDKIQRANLNGSAVEDLVTTGMSWPCDIALDLAGGKMYCVDKGTNKIQRANLDGSDVENVTPAGVSSPCGIALDMAAGKMYYTNSYKIHRANLDGSSAEELFSDLSSIPVCVALAPAVYVTYQGRLVDSNDAAEGLYDFEFGLYDAPSDANRLGSTIDMNEVDVIDGYFTVQLDFGVSLFTGAARWLEIGVRPGQMNDPNVYTVLSPRQQLTSAPHAIHARTAGAVVGGITGSGTANYIAKFTGRTTIDDSAIYESAGLVGIGKTNPSAKLDVGGDIRSSSVYKIGGNTVLSVSGDRNTFVGVGAGPNTVGKEHTFVGYRAGNKYAGNQNTFVGAYAGTKDTDGCFNTFLGQSAGALNETGHRNTCVGMSAGSYNIAGSENTSLGFEAGMLNTGSNNVFIGYRAGYLEEGSDKLYIANGSPDANVLVYGDFSSGQVGLGTTDPSAQLDVNGSVKADTLKLVSGSGTSRHVLKYGSEGNVRDSDDLMMTNRQGYGDLLFGTSGQWGGAGEERERMRITDDGKVGIGTTSPAYDLDVNGDIRAIGSVYYGGTVGNADGTAYNKPDYVFEEGYDVMSIEQVEEYLKKENHLPWMTSAKQEEENGDVIDMTRMAFETVETAENLQVQAIELNKLIKEQGALIKAQQKKITALEERLGALERVVDQHQLASAKEVQK
ncbi:MAG: NHL repeat-containing protein [Planctomycetota bacterium]